MPASLARINTLFMLRKVFIFLSCMLFLGFFVLSWYNITYLKNSLPDSFPITAIMLVFVWAFAFIEYYANDESALDGFWLHRCIAVANIHESAQIVARFMYSFFYQFITVLVLIALMGPSFPA